MQLGMHWNMHAFRQVYRTVSHTEAYSLRELEQIHACVLSGAACGSTHARNYKYHRTLKLLVLELKKRFF